jgi:hypothetical protein
MPHNTKQYLAVLNIKNYTLHCTENPIYVFPEMKLRSLVPNSYIHVSVSHLYFPRQLGRLILGIYKSLKDTLMWKLGDRTL